jgi:hypothetical protein
MAYVSFFAFQDVLPLSSLDDGIYNIHIPELMHSASYDTKTGTSTDIVLSNKGRIFQGGYPSEGDLGHPIVNMRMFPNTIRVYFSSDFVTPADFNQDWAMTLVIHEWDD